MPSNIQSKTRFFSSILDQLILQEPPFATKEDLIIFEKALLNLVTRSQNTKNDKDLKVLKHRVGMDLKKNPAKSTPITRCLLSML